MVGFKYTTRLVAVANPRELHTIDLALRISPTLFPDPAIDIAGVPLMTLLSGTSPAPITPMKPLYQRDFLPDVT